MGTVQFKNLEGSGGIATDQESEAPLIKSVGKAMAILDALYESRRPLRIIDLARRLQITSSAVSRIVSTLSSGGFVDYDQDTGRLYLGFGLAQLGNATMGRREIDRIALPVMAEIAARFKNSNRYVSLGRLYRGQIVYLRGRTPEMLQRDINIVSMVPMHATAPGKVFAAWMSPAKLEAELKIHGMDPYTPRTLTTVEAFLQVARNVRSAGFGFDNAELIEDMRHVATPIFDHLGELVATLSIGGSAREMQGLELDSLTQALQHGSIEISRQLGFSESYPALQTPSEILPRWGIV